MDAAACVRACAATLVALLIVPTDVRAQTTPSAAACAATGTISPPGGLPAGSVEIVQVCRAGQRVGAATIGVQSANAGAPAGTSVAVGRSFASPVTFVTPDDVTLDVASANGNIQRIGSKTTLAQFVGAFGEVFNLAAGRISAFVKNRLSFYTVQSLNVTAASRGTIFDVDAQPGVSIGFRISEGKLALTRLVAIRLDAENRLIDGIRETDYITPQGTASITYPIPFPIYQRFPNARSARQYFSEQLAAAQVQGDEFGVENALQNIERLDGIFPPAAPVEHAANTATTVGAVHAAATASVGEVALASAILIGAVVGVSSSVKGPPAFAPQAATTQTGTIGLTSRKRAHFAFALTFK